jgi:hypothetical protein
VTNPPELQEALNRTQRWYEQTKNPIYVWEAIAWCLEADEPQSLPRWCWITSKSRRQICIVQIFPIEDLKRRADERESRYSLHEI